MTTEKKKTIIDEIFNVKNTDLYRAVNDLIDEGNPNGTYYTLLIISSIIIAAGNLLANSAILIGGMLVTPVLTPVLIIALAITVGKPNLLRRTAILIAKSVGIIMGVSLIAGLLFPVPNNAAFFDVPLFNDSLQAGFLYFIVAFMSGLAATLSWVRKNEAHILPGISIAVSLVPPVSLSAILLASGNFVEMRFFMLIFLFNIVGVIMGSLIVFSLLKVYRSGAMITKKVDTLIAEEEQRKKEKAIEKAANTITESQE